MPAFQRYTLHWDVLTNVCMWQLKQARLARAEPWKDRLLDTSPSPPASFLPPFTFPRPSSFPAAPDPAQPPVSEPPPPPLFLPSLLSTRW